jgi:predicted DNA-binding ArsR family transcriptional regulator
MADKRNKGRDIQAAGIESDWLTELAKTLAVKPAPPGWYTITDISQKLGMGRTATRTLLNKQKAMVERFYQVTSDGRRVLLTHYKL